MATLYHQIYDHHTPVEKDLSPFELRQAIEKTRQALEIAYAGFDNVTDFDLIDSYIYEINSLQKRYKNLVELAEKMPEQQETASHAHSAIRALVSHVFG